MVELGRWYAVSPDKKFYVLSKYKYTSWYYGILYNGKVESLSLEILQDLHLSDLARGFKVQIHSVERQQLVEAVFRIKP